MSKGSGKEETSSINTTGSQPLPIISTPEAIAEELEALVEIFPEITFHTYSTHTLVTFPISLTENQLIQVQTSKDTHLISALPPVVLQVSLRHSYPSTDSPPRFHLAASYVPIEHLRLTADSLQSSWISEEPILFNWVLLVQENLRDAILKQVDDENERYEYCLELNECQAETTDSRLTRFSENVDEVLQSIIQYAHQVQDKRVQDGDWKCPACWELVKGSECLQLKECQHIACKECLQGFWESRINDGRVDDNDLVCAEMNCKASARADEIRAVISEKAYEKWQYILQGRSLELLPNTTQCGREKCEGVAWIDEDDELLAQCAYCGYNFCRNCGMTWHGKQACSFKADLRLALDEDEEDESVNEEKTELTLQRLVTKVVEANEEERDGYFERMGPRTKEMVLTQITLIESNTKKCPNCEINVEKTGGCARMTCRCGISFCWECNEILMVGYGHFEPGIGCNLYVDEDRQRVHEEVWDLMMEEE